VLADALGARRDRGQGPARRRGGLAARPPADGTSFALSSRRCVRDSSSSWRRSRRENADLRHKLAAERARARGRSRGGSGGAHRMEQAQEEARQGVGEARAEARRLRSRLEELEGQARTTRSTERDDRSARALRAPTAARHAARRRARAAPRARPWPRWTSCPPTRGAGLDEEGPAPTCPPCPVWTPIRGLLEQLLALPRAHLIVDGYNVDEERVAEPAAWNRSGLGCCASSGPARRAQPRQR
jgi:hypothetical protein